MRLLDLIFASRPMLLIPVWTVYLIALHYHNQLTGDSFDLLDLVMMVSLTLLFAGAFYINQVFDFESDSINRKGYFLQKGLLTQKQLMLAFLACSVVPIAVAFLVYSTVTLAIFAQILLLSYIYSAPPLRLKDRPFGGLLANMYAHGWLVSLSVMPSLHIDNAGLLGWDSPFYFSLAVGGAYLLTTIPDMEGDRQTGKKTMAVQFGTRQTILFACVLTIGSIVIAFNSKFVPLLYISAAAFFLILIVSMIPQPRLILIAAKLPLLLIMLLASYWYPYYLLFIVALLAATRIYYLKRFGIVYPRLN